MTQSQTNQVLSNQIAQTFSWLRAMSGGKLTQSQVDAGNDVINQAGLKAFADTIGFDLDLSHVSGQRDISSKGYDLIKSLEGLKTKAYLDVGGVPTIGYGTVVYPTGKAVKIGDSCTADQALAYLKNDCKWVDACLDKYVTVKVSQNQFDALASFIYNVGETAFKTSMMLKFVNNGNFTAAANQFDRWVYVKGKIVDGLVNRRAKEKSMFLTA